MSDLSDKDKKILGEVLDAFITSTDDEMDIEFDENILAISGEVTLTTEQHELIGRLLTDEGWL